MSGSNAGKLQSYAGHIQDYIDGTSTKVEGGLKSWLDAALAGFSAEARIVELGSAFGRDAAYVLSQGFRIECTDAVSGFVQALEAKGFAARLFNALTDDLPGPYDLILANAVMLHFTRDELALVLGKMRRALGPGGRFAFSLKRGQGEAWSSEKIGAPRFFCYWEQDRLVPVLSDAGFSAWTIDAASMQRAHAEWLFVIASA